MSREERSKTKRSKGDHEVEKPTSAFAPFDAVEPTTTKSDPAPKTLTPVEFQVHKYDKAIASIHSDQATADVVLLPSDSQKKHYAHKNVLASQSVHFYSLFYGKDSPKDKSEYTLNVTSQMLTFILKYLYTIPITNCNLSLHELIELYDSASALSIQPLCLHCLSLMTKEEATMANMCTLWPWATQLERDENEQVKTMSKTLIENCKACFFAFPQEVFESRRYLIWSKEFILERFLAETCSPQKDGPFMLTASERRRIECKFVLKIICEWIKCNLGVSHNKNGDTAVVSSTSSMSDLRQLVQRLLNHANDLVDDAGSLHFFLPFFETCVLDEKYITDKAVLRIYQTLSK
ncbi:BTB/POZ domain-containing protein [Acrasis kona]|uniref:BTB/POZ domain-containing protein n=1 Tax=Acrasis kona TaxID=1008807 RepID=A0AAW2ZGB4_9EUKA